jgi:O-methyltransferase
MKALAPKIQSLAVMCLDGDMYESFVDVLYRLYDKLSIGGYITMDDWFGFPAKTACEDFFQVHDMNVTIVPIDKYAAYWQKTMYANRSSAVEIRNGTIQSLINPYMSLLLGLSIISLPLLN